MDPTGCDASSIRGGRPAAARVLKAARPAVTALVAALLFVLIQPDHGVYAGNTLTVDTTEDNLVDLVCNDGDCSLRAALTNVGPFDTIDFEIATGCFGDICGISVNSELPPITDAGVKINGYTQNTAAANSAGPGQASNTQLRVVVNGTNCAGSCDGLVVNADDVSIKGLDIILFGGNGILINGADRVVIEGNYIGPNVFGTLDSGNGNGIRIDDGSNIVIGGSTNAARNVISGNGQAVIMVGSNGSSAQNTISGNFVGTTSAGNVALPNSSRGITLIGATFATIGGDTAQERNVISANGDEGVALTGASDDNIVSGNYIGMDLTGAVALGNGSGLSIPGGGTRNTVGGDTAAERNVISGNVETGVTIQDSSTNTVSGNYIGTDVTGAIARPNLGAGVVIEYEQQAASGNVIGGDAAGERNVISGNTGEGVVITGEFASGNVVSGNYIGTDAAGTAPLPNGVNGVSVDSPGNRIGGPVGEGNVISAHETSGISLDHTEATGNVIQGNYIGLDATGTVAMVNEVNGIFISNADDTVVGGVGLGNVVAPGGRAGVRVSSSTFGTVIQGNRIGTNAAGTASLGVDGTGIEVSSAVTIGGAAAGEGNLLSGNFTGIEVGPLDHTGAQTIRGNVIGAAADGVTPLPNTGPGIDITAGVLGLSIGGTGAGAGNLIAFNGGPGVLVEESTADGVTIEGNSIHSNDILGVDLGDDGGPTPNDALDSDPGANGLQNHPDLQALGPGQVEVSLHSSSNSTFRITLYASDECDDSKPQGQTYLQTLLLSTDGSGDVSTAIPMAAGGLLTALATGVFSHSTSEFSACESVEGLATATPSATASATPTPTATPEGQTPSPTAVGQTPTPTPTPTLSPSPTPEGQTPTPTEFGQTPTPTPDGDEVVWGDLNCSGDADPIDSLLVLRFDAGLSTNTGQCPPLGDGVGVAGVTERVWGDIDCSGEVNPVDSLKLLRFDAGLSVAQEPECPPLGEPVNVNVAARRRGG